MDVPIDEVLTEPVCGRCQKKTVHLQLFLVFPDENTEELIWLCGECV